MFFLENEKSMEYIKNDIQFNLIHHRNTTHEFETLFIHQEKQGHGNKCTLLQSLCFKYRDTKVFKNIQRVFVLSFHGKDLLDAIPSRGIERILWNFLLRQSDKIVTCSEFLKKDLILFNNLCESKAVAIHNGIDPVLFKETVHRHLGFDIIDRKFILNVATLEHKKGQDILLKAFAEVEADFPDVSLVLIGRPGGLSIKSAN